MVVSNFELVFSIFLALEALSTLFARDSTGVRILPQKLYQLLLIFL